MKWLQIMLLAVIMVGATTLSYAQLTAKDIKIQYNKESKQLKVVKVDGSDVTAQFKMEHANVDIFDNAGSYAGSIEVKSWKIPTDQFASGEIAKIASICVKEIASNKTIELNDVPLEWE